MLIKKITICAMCLSLAIVTSFIRIYQLPFGGAITLCSMLFISIIGYWYGTVTGLIVGVCYGVFNFFQEPVFLSPIQVIFDYGFSFAALGLSGIFKNSKNGLKKGYIFSIFMRGLFSTIAGYIFWMDYIPENFPKNFSMFYSVIYNYSYILVEGIITLIIISVPTVSKAINSISKSVK